MRKGWEKKALKDTCKVFADGDWIESKDQSAEGIRLVQTGNIGFGFFKNKEEKARYISEETFKRLNCTEILPGDLLVSRLPDPVGKACIIPDINTKMITGVDCTIIRPDDNLLSEFLCYYQRSNKYLNDVQAGVSGSTRQRISRKNLGLIEIPLPPLEEQQRIVAILDEAFEAIDKAKANTEQNLKNAKELFESELQRVFSKKGKDWEEKTLGDIGKPSMCKRILKNQTLPSGDVPFYKIGTFGKKPNAFISQEIYDEFRTKYSFPKKGDVLISASGTIGRRVRYDGKPAFFQDSNIVWIANDEKQVLNDYLYVFYEFCDWQPSKGATIARLYNSNLTSIKISFPKSIKEQQTIVSKLDALQEQTKKLEAVYTQKLQDLEELKKSMLQKAFSGELTGKSEKIVK
ncbi:restriction endonuclease subunit S [Flavobacterium sp.]